MKEPDTWSLFSSLLVPMPDQLSTSLRVREETLYEIDEHSNAGARPVTRNGYQSEINN
ncbi:hypothetical protein METP2_03248 [Methanosarcinales archaeon]|uniref:hypothetical protein n=1 Tax=Candidatus Methanoperedens sp. BLZ2 TaxID=2035255 RepID=UPI0015963F12|nr:hypothetical protein [Candidatus Methanoperedens sp. BLZ2]MBZ0177387.1 hypothetical protein [Candidatus Methanoperedens nitroreducens]MCX9077817.1 hypothetical protein [Candidatus Methanoperedens sp.]MCX9087917.1 hypothetical protein [Candidatus Methanoperedens sp.]CAG1000815.1 hypothetical protein METP2_03248 [Methanosarcinales archaeon]